MYRLASLVSACLLVAVAQLGSGIAPINAQDATPAASEADCLMTTPEENEALVQRFIDEVYNGHNPELAAEFLAEDFNRTNPSRPHRNEAGVADDIARVQRTLDEFPDFTNTIDHLIAEDDLVVAMLTIRGTHLGDFEDLGVEATGRAAEWTAVYIWRIECGKLAENWVVTDRLSQHRQLGIIVDDELATVHEPTVATPVP